MREKLFAVLIWVSLLLEAHPAFSLPMPLPVGQQVFPPFSTLSPVHSPIPSQAEPIGIGAVAAGGNAFRVQIGLDQASGPVDIYLALSGPVLGPEVFVLTPAGLQPLSAGLAPWMSGMTGPIDDVTLLPDTPTSALDSAPGTYTFYLAVTRPGDLSNFYLWETTFAVGATAVVFSYPPSPSGGLIQSSRVVPDGSDQDMYAYNDFTLGSTESITEVDWRGGYIHNAMYGRATDFTITFFESIEGGSQPHVTRPDTPEIYLAKYTVGGDAGETPAGTFGGTAMYDYKFRLPTPFQAVAGTKYWLRIEASQSTYPDWGIAVGTGGDGQYFRFSTGDAMFQTLSGGDTAFTLRR